MLVDPISSLNLRTNKMSRSVSTGSKKKWHPQTTKYEYNYGVGMNFYQPMIDYIDEKKMGRRPERPHLPWTDELGLDQFSPHMVRSYSDENFDTILRETEASAQRRLRDFKSSAKTSFVLSKSVSAASVSQKVKRETRRKKVLVKQIDKLKSNIHEGLDNYFAHQDTEKLDFASQKFLRGKSAKQIETQLLAQADKVISEGIKEDVEKEHKSLLERVHHVRSHQEMMERRAEENLEESFVRPLQHLSYELKDFDDRTTMFFYDKR